MTKKKKGKEKTENKILGMLTIANIISHYRESASPCEFPIALCESRGPQSEKWVGGAGDHYQFRGLRSEGVSFFSRVILGHWICGRIL